jgi:hypothetical protein
VVMLDRVVRRGSGEVAASPQQEVGAEAMEPLVPRVRLVLQALLARMVRLGPPDPLVLLVTTAGREQQVRLVPMVQLVRRVRLGLVRLVAASNSHTRMVLRTIRSMVMNGWTSSLVGSTSGWSNLIRV